MVVRDAAAFADGVNTALFVGGSFDVAGGFGSSRLARWGTPRRTSDINGDGVVGVTDLLILLANWGPCNDCDECQVDLDCNCSVGVNDLLILLANWG